MKNIGYKRLKDLNDRNKKIIKVRGFSKETCNIYRIEKHNGRLCLVSKSVQFYIFDIGILFDMLEVNLLHYKTYITNLSILCNNSYFLTHLYISDYYWTEILNTLIESNYKADNYSEDLIITKVDDLILYKSKVVLLGGKILFDKPYRFCIILFDNKVSLVSEYIFVINNKTRMFLDGLYYNRIFIDNILTEDKVSLDNIVDSCNYKEKIIKHIV